MVQTGRFKASWADVEVYHEFGCRVSSAEWWQSVDITLHAESVSSAHIWPAAPEDVQLWYHYSSQVTSWTRLDQGPGTALLHQALQGASQELRTTAVRFVFPANEGSLVRSDILSLRMVDLEAVESVVSFFTPGKCTFSPLSIHASGTTDAHAVLHALNSAVGGLLLAPALDGYQLVFLALDEEFANRLSFPWVLDGPAPRRTLAIVEGGRSSPEHGGTATSIYTAAQALDIDMIVLDEPGHWIQGSHYTHWRKEFLPVQLEPPSLLRDRVLDALSGRKVDAIVTFCDAYQVTIAQVAEQLGLPTVPAEAYEIATDKYRTGISEGRPAHLVHNLQEALQVVEHKHLEFPFIVKPCKGFLSEGVFKVYDIEDLSRAIQDVNLDRHGAQFVLEQYCDGPEVDINFVISQGEVLFCEISDDFPKTADITGHSARAPVSFIELGNVLPSKLPSAETDLLRTSLHQSLMKLQLTTGIYHLEARVQHSSMKYGPVPSALDLASDMIDLIPRETTPAQMPYAWLIEINPRPPGIQETAAVESTYGVDYWGIALLAALCDHRRLAALAHPFRNGPQYWCEMIFIPVTSGGIFASDDVCADLVQRRPDLAKHISKSFCFLRRGDVVPSPLSGITAWVAYFIVFSRVSREHLLVLSADIRSESRFSVVAH